MTLLIAIALVAAIVPQRISFLRLSPGPAAAICLAALLLRALAAALLATFVLLYVPATPAFASVAGWCWHGIIPGLPVHVSLNGHPVGDAATLVPIAGLTASLASAAWAVAAAARTARRVLAHGALARGPSGTLIVGGAEVMVAAAGISRPRIVLSAGALMSLDDEELAASVAHERGHVARSHRFILLLAQLARGTAWVVPGTTFLYRELVFQLERDADVYALARRHDGLALASAICKAAESQSLPTLGLRLAGNDQIERRVRDLVDRPSGPDRRAPRGGPMIAGALLATVVALTLSLPAAAANSPVLDGHAPATVRCPA